MSRIPAILALSLIAALGLVWGLVLNTAFAGENNGNFAGYSSYFAQDADATPTPTPSPTITLSPNSGWPGELITLRGEGFKTNAQVQSVEVVSVEFGSIEITPHPAPSTNAQGITEFDILIPGLDAGRHSISVQAGGNSVGADFTIRSVSTPTPTPTPLPPPTITLSANSGAWGSAITVRVEGAKTFVPVRNVKVSSVDLGWVDVLPLPAPSTNAQGMAEFDIIVPLVGAGRYTIEVEVSGSSPARVGFTITRPTPTPYPTPTPTPYPTAASTPAPTAEPPQLPGGGNEPPHIFAGQATLNGSPAGTGVAIDAYDAGRRIGATVTQAGGRFSIHVHRAEGVITFRVNNQAAAESYTAWRTGQVTTGFDLTAGGVNSRETDPGRLFAALPALARAFNFDNATKSWSFFDPAAADVSTLTRFIPLNSYWLLVTHTTRLLLNEVERDLYCVEDNCWNLIVW